MEQLLMSFLNNIFLNTLFTTAMTEAILRDVIKDNRKITFTKEVYTVDKQICTVYIENMCTIVFNIGNNKYVNKISLL